MNFICPICSAELIDLGASLICENSHCFDKAKSGYVNLLISSNRKGHGDDKLMVQSRKQFLDLGYYKPLLNELEKAAVAFTPDKAVILDSGCGEGWYSENILNTLVNAGKTVEMLAIDISKDALNFASKRCKSINFAVASAYRLPIADKCCNMVISLFAPFAKAEFERVLKANGCILTAIPLKKHLFGLKSAVYDEPYENEVEPFEIDGFKLERYTEVKERIMLKSNADIKNLFMMTPYYYKTSATDQSKLDKLTSLETEIEFAVALYREKE